MTTTPLVDGNELVATTTGASDCIFLPERQFGQDWTVFYKCATWGDADVQLSDNREDWGDAITDQSTPSSVLNLTLNGSFRCPGPVYVRLNVTTITVPITLTAV